ncbi:type II toxin-antitoxin system VapC family toxin [Pyrofollis japonicus]|uniref:type II toxin-antitoxin system VapC family toxin n=1 Tax=Pyrofollis japonicus TaxID=3060460 RepID=UPI00295AAD2C|nr:type II toxin-antitoxin system VapC family toxin [Pyrofollis japonicus]BEP16811.1 type II toxin-antitoxin system VapC family toxin [Pyrofollis japonicus]
MIVADASALATFFLREEGWERLTPYMRLVVTLDMAVKEFYNAVWKAVKLHKFIGVSEAERILKLFRRYLAKNIVLRNELEYVDEAFRIAVEESVTVYDALYLVLALREKAALLSLDKRQRSIALRRGIEVLPP